MTERRRSNAAMEAHPGGKILISMCSCGAVPAEFGPLPGAPARARERWRIGLLRDNSGRRAEGGIWHRAGRNVSLVRPLRVAL